MNIKYVIENVYRYVLIRNKSISDLIEEWKRWVRPHQGMSITDSSRLKARFLRRVEFLEKYKQ